MSNWLTLIPTWGLIRTAGAAAYLLLFGGIVTGILSSMPQVKGVLKSRLYKLHARLLDAGLIIGLAHGLLLAVDAYLPFGWRDIVVPFTSSSKPVWNGLGSLAFYGMLLITITTDFKTVLGHRAWRIVHMMAYPVFAAALLHGIGWTDSGKFWVQACYAATGSVVVILTAARVAAGWPRSGKPTGRSSRKDRGKVSTVASGAVDAEG